MNPLGDHRPTPAQSARASQFAELPPPAGCVVFLGDSLTEGGVWHEWFPEVVVANRGIAGDTVRGVRQRLDQALNDPRMVSLLVGTNDLTRTRDIVPIVTEFRSLVEQIRRSAPAATLVITGVPPRTLEYRERILSLNDACREIAAANCAEWIDLWPVLATAEGALAEEYTYDGLHLMSAGYRAWVDELKPRIAAALPVRCSITASTDVRCHA